MDVCRYRIASGGTPVVRHLIFTSSTPILQHQSSVSHRWDRVSYDLVCRENLRRWTHPAPREYARIKSLTDRKSTRLNSSHGYNSYAVFFFKKKKKNGKTHNTTSCRY